MYNYLSPFPLQQSKHSSGSLLIKITICRRLHLPPRNMFSNICLVQCDFFPPFSLGNSPMQNTGILCGKWKDGVKLLFSKAQSGLLQQAFKKIRKVSTYYLYLILCRLVLNYWDWTINTRMIPIFISRRVTILVCCSKNRILWHLKINCCP